MSQKLFVPTTVPMVGRDGMVTEAWSLFFTKLAAQLADPALNFKYVAPNLIWTDPNGNPHVIASTP